MRSSKKRAGMAWLKKFGVFQPGDISPKFIRAQIPNSWFTKKGPGVEQEARRAFHNMTTAQRAVAIEKGWIPKSWIIPYLERYKRKETSCSTK